MARVLKSRKKKSSDRAVVRSRSGTLTCKLESRLQYNYRARRTWSGGWAGRMGVSLGMKFYPGLCTGLAMPRLTGVGQYSTDRMAGSVANKKKLHSVKTHSWEERPNHLIRRKRTSA